MGFICVVCLDRIANIVLHPCLHVAFCEECLRHWRCKRECPVCRCLFSTTEQLFFAGQRFMQAEEINRDSVPELIQRYELMLVEIKEQKLDQNEFQRKALQAQRSLQKAQDSLATTESELTGTQKELTGTQKELKKTAEQLRSLEKELIRVQRTQQITQETLTQTEKVLTNVKGERDFYMTSHFFFGAICLIAIVIFSRRCEKLI